MEDRKVKWRVGVVAVGAIVLTGMLVAISTRAALPFGGGGQREIKIELPAAPGVGPNTPVRKNGVTIGRVDEVDFTEDGVLIKASISDEVPIYVSDVCRVQPSSILGDAVISFITPQPEPVRRQPEQPRQPPPPQNSERLNEVQFRPEAQQPQVQFQRPDKTPIAEGAIIQGQIVPSPVDLLVELQTDIAPAIKSLGEAGESINRLAERINLILGDEADGTRLAALLDKSVVAMDQFSTTMDEMSAVASSIDNIVGDVETQQQLKQALGDFPVLMTDLRTTADQATKTLGTLDGAVVSAERNLRNIEGLTKPLGERGPELAQSVMSAIDNLDLTLADARRFVAALTASEGAFGQLVNNRELYDNLNTTIYNANHVILRFNETLKDLRPIVHDVRVLTDKVAREPGRVVGGALNRGPGVK